VGAFPSDGTDVIVDGAWLIGVAIVNELPACGYRTTRIESRERVALWKPNDHS
jgi:hypothetical protein